MSVRFRPRVYLFTASGGIGSHTRFRSWRFTACRFESDLADIILFLRYFILKEIWKPIEDYPQFEVSNYGKIRRIATGKVLKLNINKQGYLAVCVSLGKKGTYKSFKVHREVAKLFIPNPENKPQVNHIDGDKLNAHVTNLEWATGSENIVHAYDNDLIDFKTGEEVWCAKLTQEDVEFIRANYSPRGSNGISCRQLAKLFDIDHSVVSRIVNKKAWRYK